MVDYRQIVVEQKAAVERAIAILDDSEPLDAQDEDARAGLYAAASALECCLRAFAEAEEVALDAMAAHFSATGRIELGGQRIACANAVVDDGKIACTGCGERFAPHEIVYCFNDERCCAECDERRPEKWG